VDALCSDYHFPSLLGSVALMMERGTPVPEAVNLVTRNPARILGWSDLGSIEVGMKADLAAFHLRESHAFVSSAWVDGRLKLQLGGPVGRAVAY
jgi:alpha-D-ribose 1-methylphosphonate 5-triphosphate diphosphatase